MISIGIIVRFALGLVRNCVNSQVRIKTCAYVVCLGIDDVLERSAKMGSRIHPHYTLELPQRLI